MKHFLALAATLIVTSFASAQEAPTFRFQPEPDFGGTIVRAVEGIKPMDAFSGVEACKIIDVKFIKAPTLEEAVKLMAPCLDSVSATYGVKVTIRQGTPATPENEMGVQVQMLLLEVPQGTTITSPVMKDLNRALSARKSRLFGHQTMVVRAEPQITAQKALDVCILPTVVRQIQSGADFIKFYGTCLKKTAEFQITDMQPWPGKRLGVIVTTKAPKLVQDRLTTPVMVDGAEGPVVVELVAYSAPVAL
jgi:hypothetical protein